MCDSIAHRRRFQSSFLLLPALMLAASLPAAGASPAEGHLSDASPPVAWTGPTFTAAATLGTTAGCFDAFGRPAAVLATTGPTACDVFALFVDLTPSFWDGKEGGVTVELSQFNGEDFELLIYRRNADGTRGALMGSSATANPEESFLIDKASGGYYVVASPYAVVSSDYHGQAEVSFSATGRPLGSYLHDVSEPIPGVTTASSILVHDRIPAPDGKLLDAWVLRPNLPEAVPVVLEVTPYYGGGDPMDPTNVLAGNFRLVAGQLVPRGYAVALASVRGTGNSEGCFTIGGPDEAKDTAAIVQHYAGQPWSNGRVGMMGVSYPGTTPQDAWVEAPPGLKTIVPIAGISDLYKYNFVNGVHIDPQGYAFNTYYWALVGLSPVGLNGGNQLRDPVNVPGAVVGEVCPEQFWVQEGQLSSAIDGNKDGYWQLRDFLAELRQSPNKSRASVFYIHGLQDWNVKPHNMEDWLPAVLGTSVPYHVWLGQWGHAYPDRPDWWTTLTAWYDQFLKGRDTGILDAPRVQVKDDDGRWRHEKEWPPRRVKKLTLHPRPDGTLGSAALAGSASYHDYAGTQPPLALPLGPDQVVFVSEPLEKDLHLSGLPGFEGDVTASGDRASLILTLAERTPEGDRAFNYAAVSLNHVRDLAYGDPSVAGRTQRVAVNFFPQDDVVHAGNRIVLIASGNAVKAGGQPGPDLRPLASGSMITLDLGEAKLILPNDRTLTYE
jgi:X-Pro dipeptidyl-peptidase